MPHALRASFHATATLGSEGSFAYTGSVDVLVPDFTTLDQRLLALRDLTEVKK